MTKLQTTACGLLAALVLAAPASAEIYRWTGADGRVHYGDRRAVSAGRGEHRPDLAVAADPSSTPPPATESADAVRARVRERLAVLEQAQAEIRAATDALRAAEERRERGIEPLPGERLGMQGGGSRLAPQYFERQAGLEQEVSAARARLDRAHARRNELR